MNRNEITGVVLAGGRSTRMGRDKATLVFEGRTLVERCGVVLAECFPRTLVVGDDDQPGLGPIGGLATALRRVETAAVFVVACDLPFLRATLVRHVVSLWNTEDAAAIRVNGRFEPLLAGYRREVLPVVQEQITAGDCSLQHLLGKLRVREVTEAELAGLGDWRKCLRNVNTPAEWRAVQSSDLGLRRS